MTVEHFSAWTTMSSVAQAADGGDFGAVLRTAHVAAGLTVKDAARLAGISASTLSRMETKPGRVWDVRDLRLHDDGMAWATADRAIQAARAGDDRLTIAEARRWAAIVMRRTHHRDGAQRLMLDAANQLQADTGLADSGTAATYGQLLATASYTAALRDNRDSAWTLLGEAENAARRTRLTKNDRFNTLELAVYKISVSRCSPAGLPAGSAAPERPLAPIPEHCRHRVRCLRHLMPPVGGAGGAR
ncbi:transcriptional regulator with XRE-family HTH domain [Kribbella aluminosa]|uniref:Transcriptional regulator with XRE-family HTH domain n=1 Tax=Kribbella aluminosa TaxID=416017 RepID=A0ABS4UIZ1_9ACTN|nr:helix-turn-helix transcriptional regulator [Kribbella aluminosa]MBP2351637.1 transcriptional regulator with XRE-family HTH domain [Kribbella aluminosa]